MILWFRTESQGEKLEDVEMKTVEVVETTPVQPEIVEQQKPVEQPAPVSQVTRATTPKDKKMMSLEERMKEFRDMLLERSVSARVVDQKDVMLCRRYLTVLEILKQSISLTPVGLGSVVNNPPHLQFS